MRAFHIEDCEKIGGRVDPERGCVLDSISYGEPSWLYGETKPRAGWLPLDVLKKFWLSDFARSSVDREQAMRELKQLGVKEVEGSIYLPLESGRYSQLYGHKSIIFVPIIQEHNSDRFVKFQPVAMRVLVPLDVKLTLKEGTEIHG
jgi:hypothetical protein